MRFLLTVCDPNLPSGFKRGSDPSHQPGSHVLLSVAQVQCKTSPRWFSCCSKSFQDTFQVRITPLLIKLLQLCAGFQAARARRLPVKLNPWSSHLLLGGMDIYCHKLGKPQFEKCRVYLGIAQIAIAPPPFTQTGTLGHFISGPT